MRCRAVLAGLTAVGLAAGGITLYAGWYDISATDQHLAPTYWLLDTGMKRSVKWRAARIAVPPLDEPALVQRGAAHYIRDCEHCHGGPGVAPQPFALGMTPSPAMLAHTGRQWPPGELFWAIKEGIKMTGMPAWKYRMADDDIWTVVAFVQRLPQLSPAEYRALGTSGRHEHAEPPLERDGDPALGRRAINQYWCVNCHRIPGIVGANAPVGPPLERMATRRFIAGVLPNTPENMVRWLREPQAIAPGNAMPDLGMSERDARDIAAYLASLK